MLSSADESIHGVAVEISTNRREILGSTPRRYNLQIEITSLGTSAWEGVYVTQVCFYTNIHICDILTAGCVRVCVCIYVCVWMRVCMDACMRL